MSRDNKEKCTEILASIRDRVNDVTKHMEHLINRAKSGELSTTKGISFLEVKYHLLLSYLSEMVCVFYRKTNGQSIDGYTGVERCTEIRTVLEKMRPIDKKLKYQVEKLLKTLTTGIIDGDPLTYKPNPNSLISKFGEELSENSEEEDEKKVEKTKTYVPPKLTPMRYDGEETSKEKADRKLEEAKKRALSSSMIQELKTQYTDAPEEIRESRDLHRIKANKKYNEKTRYEEDNFMRMSVSKKEKNAMKQISTVGSLGALAQFDDISALTNDEVQGTISGSYSKKRKLTKAKGKKEGFKKKRRH